MRFLIAMVAHSSLYALKEQATPNVRQAISQASSRTGEDFAYLLRNAAIESGLDPYARSAISSATGLYQFIDQTWLETVRDYGARHGLGRYADAIDANGQVKNPALRQEILDLRKKPDIAAAMAAELTAANRTTLSRKTGKSEGAITDTDLYLAHFMGANGASQFLSAMDRNGATPAANLFPEQAQANRGVFFDRAGNPRTLNEIYARFENKFNQNISPADSIHVTNNHSASVERERQNLTVEQRDHIIKMRRVQMDHHLAMITRDAAGRPMVASKDKPASTDQVGLSAKAGLMPLPERHTQTVQIDREAVETLPVSATIDTPSVTDLAYVTDLAALEHSDILYRIQNMRDSGIV